METWLWFMLLIAFFMFGFPLIVIGVWKIGGYMTRPVRRWITYLLEAFYA